MEMGVVEGGVRGWTRGGIGGGDGGVMGGGEGVDVEVVGGGRVSSEGR